MTHYTAIVLISSAVILGMLLGIRGNSFMDSSRKHWFQCLFLILVTVNWMEWIAATMDGDPNLTMARTLAKFLELSLAPLIPLIGMRTIDDKKKYTFANVICIANVILQVISLFTGIVFTIDANSVYERHSFYYLYIVFLFSVTVLYSIDAIKEFILSNKYQVKNAIFLYAIFALNIVTIARSLNASHLRLDWVSISFAVLLYYIYMAQLLVQNDSLTELLNRHMYDASIEKVSPGTIVLFLDIDRFKEMNDTYGHIIGDECLVQVGAALKETFGKAGYCFRYGGDEFAIILYRNQENVEHYIEDLQGNVAKKKLSIDLDMPELSIGYATVEAGMTGLEITEAADAKMYEKKQARKANRA